MQKLIVFLFLSAVACLAQTNSACPGATGSTPHCVTVSWTAPTSGPTPTGYNVYTGGTSAGQCSTVSATTCTKVGSVASGVLTLTQNSSATTTLTEGKTYFYVVTSTNSTAESAPSVEVSVLIPFLVPNPPVNPTATAK